MGVPKGNYVGLFFIISLITVPTSPTIEATRILEFKDIEFTNWQQNVTYVSSTSYHAKGMAPLYKATNTVLGAFIGDDAIPEGYIVVTDRNVELGPKVQENDWADLAKHYWGLIVVLIISVLLIVLTPIVGLCFCCCRCAGNCGGRSQPFDKKHDTCRRVILGLFLICASTAIVFGVVVAFVTNSYMQHGVENITTSAREGVDDTTKYLRTTSEQVNHLLVKNYNELTVHLRMMLDETAAVTMARLEEESNAISLTQLNTFVQTLPQIKTDLEDMKRLTNELRNSASQLNDGLRGVKRKLLDSLTKCAADACQEVLSKYEIGKLDANGIDYNQLPDVTAIIDNVNELISGKLMTSLNEGKTAVDDVKNNLNRVIGDNIPKVTTAINDAGLAIKDASIDFTRTIDRMTDMTTNHSYKYLDTADEYIKEYSNYRFYVGLGISSVLLIILLSISLGLLCGICGKRPDGYGDDCCNKGAGGRFLMLAVAIIFLTLSILTLATLIHFLAGLIVHRSVCVSLRNPADDQIFGYVDELIDLNTIIYPATPQRGRNSKSRAIHRNLQPFRISQVITSCHKNDPVYSVLQLQNYFDIRELEEYPEKYNINQLLKNLIDSVEIESNVTILSEQTKADILRLSQSELNNFDADRFENNLNDDITKHNLTEIAIKLRETAKNIPDKPDMIEIKMSLKNQALHLQSYQDNLVVPMIENTQEILRLAKNLDRNLDFNSTSFENAIKKFLAEVESAQDFINNQGTPFVRQVVEELTTSFKAEIINYLALVIRTIEFEIGRCAPISNAYNAMLVASCNRIVDPFNGFWAGVGWCILIFLPTVILCVKLSSLYQKSDPYPGPLVESEYLYDAYSERDNIPLANGPKNKRRNKKYDRRRSERRDFYEDSNSSHGPGNSSRDARYNDMAPKHWEGGPPRYQSPPMAPPATEYERPPPYYFPGAPSEQE